MDVPFGSDGGDGEGDDSGESRLVVRLSVRSGMARGMEWLAEGGACRENERPNEGVEAEAAPPVG